MNTNRRETAILVGIVLGGVGFFGIGIWIGNTFSQPQPQQQQPFVIIVHGTPSSVTCVPATACRLMSWSEATGTLGAEAPR